MTLSEGSNLFDVNPTELSIEVNSLYNLEKENKFQQIPIG